MAAWAFVVYTFGKGSLVIGFDRDVSPKKLFEENSDGTITENSFRLL